MRRAGEKHGAFLVIYKIHSRGDCRSSEAAMGVYSRFVASYVAVDTGQVFMGYG
jgi:hypothetical protein